MNYLDMSIEQLHAALVNKEVTPVELANLALEKAKEVQPDLNAFVTIIDDAVKSAEKLDAANVNNPLFGIPCAVKDNYSTKGILTTASSNILKDYVPVFDAEVIAKLQNAGAVIMGKTVLDELAMGGTGMNGATGFVNNPWSKNRNQMAGGSSAGSAAAVAAGIVPFAIGSDTGDSVRKPAAYCGIVGFKPSWGRISRYGLFPFAPSLDHVAFFTRNVKDSAYVLEALAGGDTKDMTSSTKPVENYSQNLDGNLKGKRIALILNINNSIKEKAVVNNFNEVVEKAKKAGAIIIEDNMDIRLLKAILPVYQVISCAEATSNNANLDGIKFGPRADGKTYDEVTTNTRTEGFSELVKRRFVLGTYCLARENQDALFLRAQKIRHMIVDELNRILSNADAILLPAAGNIAPLFKGAQDEKLSDNYLIAENHLALGNFSGMPSLTLPSGFLNDMPLGVNVMAKPFDEQMVLNVSYGLEQTMNYKNQIAKEGK